MILHKLLRERKNLLYMIKGAIIETPLYQQKEEVENRISVYEIIVDLICYLNSSVLNKSKFRAELGGCPLDTGQFIVVHDGETGYQIDLSLHLWHDKNSLQASNDHIIIIEPIVDEVYKRWLELE